MSYCSSTSTSTSTQSNSVIDEYMKEEQTEVALVVVVASIELTNNQKKRVQMQCHAHSVVFFRYVLN